MAALGTGLLVLIWLLAALIILNAAQLVMTIRILERLP